MTARLSTRLLAAQSDQRLVELSQQGYERAFELLVKRYRKPLLRYCARMGLSPARSEDVVQQALLQAWLAIQRGSEVRELRAWLYRIAHNAAVNAMRRPEAHPLSDALHVTTAATAEPEQMVAMRATLGGVAELPQMQRDAIVLSAIDGRSHEEVASTLGISEGAVRGLLYRARVTLRAAAAALTPTPVLAWASGYVTRGAQTGGGAPGLPELTAAGGAAGVGGVLLKGAAIAVSTAALVAGAAVKLHGNGGAHRVGDADTPTWRQPKEAVSSPAAQAHQLASAGVPARHGGSGGGIVTRRSTPALGEPVASLGPSHSSFTYAGGSRPVTRKPAVSSGPAEWVPAAATQPATVKVAAVPTLAVGSGGQTLAAGTPPPTTTPTTATPPPGTEGTPPPTEPTGKPPVGGEPPQKEPGDEPPPKKEPLPGEKPPVHKDE
jgi:RNA polymerase sigma factor (sigma-70 family)